MYALAGDQSGSRYVNVVDRAFIMPDGSLAAWQATTPLPTPRIHVAAVSAAGYIYALGGYSGGILDTVERALIGPAGALGPWETISHMTLPRVHHAAVVHGDYLYVIGGNAGGPLGTISDVERARINSDGSLSGWEAVAPLPSPRQDHAAVVGGDDVYALGGLDSAGTYLSDVQHAHVNPDGWLDPWETTRALPTGRAFMAAVPGQGDLYVLGGADDGGLLQDVKRSAISSDGSLGLWEMATALTVHRGFLAAATTGTHVYVLGGYTGGALVSGTVGSVEMTEITIHRPIDTSPPRASGATADGFWHAADVSLVCTVDDGESGLSDPADASFSLSTAVPTNTETANAATGARQVCDVAGNCLTAGPIGGNMVDKRAPTISIHAPSPQSYFLGGAIAADYDCGDGGSGVATCTGPVALGSNIDTSSAGTKPFTVVAADRVGNLANGSVQYSVIYSLCLLYNRNNAHKSGSTAPLKVQLCDVNGQNRSSAGVGVRAIALSLVSTDTSQGTELL